MRANAVEVKLRAKAYANEEIRSLTKKPDLAEIRELLARAFATGYEAKIDDGRWS